MRKSKYGESLFYAGDAGMEYFARQNTAGLLHGSLNAWKFEEWVSPSRSLLDFGCGGGWLLKELSAERKVGIDMNPAARKVCAENGIEAFENVDNLPLGSGFDLIVSHHCLEHIPYPIQALRELRGVLAADGQFILVVPIDDWRVQRDVTGADPDHHLHTWTPRLLANTLAEAGFTCQRIDVLTHAWPRGWPILHRWLPSVIFNAICWIWAILVKRRQLRAVSTATKPSG